MAYWIRQHVHLCATDRGVVFLDLNQDRYLGIGLDAAHALEGIVCNWPASGHHGCGSGRDAEIRVQGLVDRLERAGLLTQDPGKWEIHPLVSLEEPEMPSSRALARRLPAIRVGHVAVFVRSCMVAAMRLHCRSLKAIVQAVASRKVAAMLRGARYSDARTLELSSIFARLRPYFFASNDRCLFHALALVDFLAWHGQFPTWVVGVKTFPFGAHSWVQQGTLVFDEQPHELCGYTPILAV